MSNNKKSLLALGIAITLIVLASAYFLFKNSSSTGDPRGLTKPSPADASLNSLIGKPLPDIQLQDINGKVYTNASFKGKNTVLFFSEGLMCYPACWNQIAGFGTDPRFNTGEIQALSVLVDSSRDWQRAIDKMPELAKANTLFDVGGSVSGKLGLLSLPSSMHRGSLPGHTYIVLDKDGIVRYVDDDPNMAMANDWLIKKIAEFNK